MELCAEMKHRNCNHLIFRNNLNVCIILIMLCYAVMNKRIRGYNGLIIKKIAHILEKKWKLNWDSRFQ